MKNVEKITVDVLVDNTADMLSTRPAHVTSELRVLMDAGMEEMAGESLCIAQHGISLAVTAHFAGETRIVLFDSGPDPGTLERNAGQTGFDFGKVDALVLSHGHFDHSEGLLKAAEMIRALNGGKRVPLHVHPGSFVRRGDRLPEGGILPLQDVPGPDELERAGLTIIYSTGPEEIAGGVFYLSGEIPRRSFEKGLENQVRIGDTGDWEPDPLVMEERFMAAHLKGKGLALFSGCSHAGVINICTHARELFPDVPLYALVGGLHLVYPNEGFIEETVDVLKDFGIRLIIPGHCTGWRAVHALINAFGEDVVNPLAVGSRLSF
jgi:7,8-dihydropterin-6-yl-methyl-4-(beta-D-ribofuranosyl)aminobenzene 5'-phosphate synthase